MGVQEAASEAVNGDGIAWPVVVIGGLIVLAGLVAVRQEFANLRTRRAERRVQRR